MFIICKQLNGSVLKSLKRKLFGRKLEKKLAWPGRAQPKILYFVSGRTGLGPKFQFAFQAGPGTDLNFNFFFWPGRARTEKSDPCRPLVFGLQIHYIAVLVCQERKIGKRTDQIGQFQIFLNVISEKKYIEKTKFYIYQCFYAQFKLLKFKIFYESFNYKDLVDLSE